MEQSEKQQNNERKQKNFPLIFYRLIAALLVMLAHLAGTGMYAYEIPCVINGVMEHPIMEYRGNVLAFLDSFLYYKLNTQNAVVGVVMFFILSGYLTARSLKSKRYTKREFYLRRALRIFPTLWISLIAIGITVYISQGIVFSPFQYVTSGLLLYQVFHVATVTGVIWFLVILVFFYILVGMVKEINLYFISYIHLVIITVGVFYYEFRTPYAYDLLYNLRYMGFILIGISLFLAQESRKENKSKLESYWPVVYTFVANLLIFKINKSIFGDDSTYCNFFTSFIPLLLIIVCLTDKCSQIFSKMPSFILSGLSYLSDLSYPYYLTHVAVGLNCMYWVSRFRGGINRYVVFTCGVLVSFIVAAILHYLEKKIIGLLKNKILEQKKQ